MFESESDKKCENKYNIDNIRPYPIRLHPYALLLLNFVLHYKAP